MPRQGAPRSTTNTRSVQLRDTRIVIATEQVALLEDLRHDGFSTLESAALGAGGYLVTTNVLGGSTIEALIVAGTTFLAAKGGSQLIGWIF